MKKTLLSLIPALLLLSACSQLKELTVVSEADLASLPNPADLIEHGVAVRKDWKEKRTVEKSGRPILYVQLTARYFQEASKGYGSFIMNVVTQEYRAWSSAKTASLAAWMGVKKAVEADGIILEKLPSPEGKDWGSDFEYYHLLKDSKPVGCLISTRHGTRTMLVLFKGLYFESPKDEHFTKFFDKAFPRFKEHSLAAD